MSEAAHDVVAGVVVAGVVMAVVVVVGGIAPAASNRPDAPPLR